MGFQIVRAETRAARMIGWLSGICQRLTDFYVGSKVRTKIEAIAVEMEAMDFEWYRSLTKAIPIAIYQAFGFTIESATKASGPVTFTADQAPVNDVTIPAGTRVATLQSANDPEKVYITTSTVTLLAGQTTVGANVNSVTTGEKGNTAAASITVLKGSIPGISSVTNQAALRNGKNRQTEAERTTAFQQFIAGLDHASDDAVRRGALTANLTDGNGDITEKVTQAVVVGTPQYPAGRVYCFIYNGIGATSADLVAQAQKIINGYRKDDGTTVVGYKAAGIIATVAAAIEAATDVTVTVTRTDTQTVDADPLEQKVRDTISAYIGTLSVGDPLLRNKLIELLMGIPGVKDVALTLPANNVAANYNGIITPGAITVTVN